MRLVTILNKILKFKYFLFEKSKFGKKIKKQGQGQPTIEIEIEIERLTRLNQLQNFTISTSNKGNKIIAGMEVWRYGGMEVWVL